MKKKFVLILLAIFAVLILTLLILINYNFLGIKPLIYENSPEKIQIIYKVLFKEKFYIKRFKNDYNVKFLPKTQFVDLNYREIELNFIKENSLEDYLKESNKPIYTFFLEVVENKIWSINKFGIIIEIEIEDLNKKIKPKIIKSNLKSIKVLDTLIYKDKIFVSFFVKNNECHMLKIASAKINSEYLNFENLFSPDECGKKIMRGGRMQFFKNNNSDGLLLTTGNFTFDQPDNRPQNDNSIFGKIIFVNFEGKNFEIFSKGHRNSQGLYVEKDLILSTEHGPRGGDEINKIIFNSNYGWPISSYGDKYYKKKNEISIPNYKNNHFSLGFQEPIFTFIPSIGISEIIKIPNNFSDHWVDNFIVSSLWGQSLYRLKFDDNYEKVIFIEKIFIGNRIRDLKYIKGNDMIIMALEQHGKLGIIKKNF